MISQRRRTRSRRDSSGASSGRVRRSQAPVRENRFCSRSSPATASCELSDFTRSPSYPCKQPEPGSHPVHPAFDTLMFLPPHSRNNEQPAAFVRVAPGVADTTAVFAVGRPGKASSAEGGHRGVRGVAPPGNTLSLTGRYDGGLCHRAPRESVVRRRRTLGGTGGRPPGKYLVLTGRYDGGLCHRAPREGVVRRRRTPGGTGGRPPGKYLVPDGPIRRRSLPSGAPGRRRPPKADTGGYGGSS